ncbi:MULTISPECIES: GntR family transcriptional regulator [Protofrankia]|uniref:Transcriptional regulator, GntR family n=1 Tax=Candidatus Protofrankia datiscae TaxID=2716812 RepID=F8AWW7_9ACTN|nr:MULTISPECIES: GntR family transcriptional regulator [Protofrankia]AEH11411.1 transcriptional regulator, GntR family [Candidatus Protofrankia datiscae]
MLFRVDTASSVSLADQIAVQVRAAVVSGDLAPGERLPAARDLARALKVNMHTVLRAYARLRDEGVIEMRQGRGAWVRPEANAAMVRVIELAAQLAAEARKLGLSLQDISRLLEQA